MPSLATLSLALCLAVAHVTSQQVWFPDQLPPATARHSQHGAVLVENVRQRGEAAQRTGRNGFVTQQNGLWKTQQNAQRRTDQGNGQRYQPSLQWNRQTGQWAYPRSGNNDQWIQQQSRNNNVQQSRIPVLAKPLNQNAAVPQRLNVNPVLPQRAVTNVKTNVKTRITDAETVKPAAATVTDEDREFDDYWLEDDLKDKQEMDAAVAEAVEAPSVAVNEIEVVEAAAPTGPSRCVWAIISCCKPTAATAEIRYTCFETLGCHGAFWDVNPCSKQMMAAALRSTANFYKVASKDDD